MDTQSSQSVTFIPQSLSEAIGWAQSVENYSFKSAFKKAPLDVPMTAVKSCRKVTRQNRDIYFLEFELKYQNVLISRSAPVHGQLPIDDAGAVTSIQFLRMLGSSDYIKKFYRHSVTTTFILFLSFAIYGFSWVKQWLMERVMNDHWFVRSGCDLSCAKKVVSLHVGFWLVASVLALPVLWGPLFYLVNKRFMRRYNYLTALRTEAAMVAVVGFVLIVGFLKSSAPAHYLSFISHYRNGTLELRQPASTANTEMPSSLKAPSDEGKR